MSKTHGHSDLNPEDLAEFEARFDTMFCPESNYDPAQQPFSDNFGLLLSPVPEAYEKALGDLRKSIRRLEQRAVEQKKGEEARPFIERAQRLVEKTEQRIRLRSYGTLKRIVDWLANADIEPDEAAINQYRKSLEDADFYDRREREHLSLLVTTPDPLGVILRGFTLLEGLLDECFQKVLARPIDLYNQFKMYFGDKVNLGHALGFVSEEERSFFIALNRERNKLVHQRATGDRSPRHIFEVEQERNLWALFVAIPSMAREWPKYDAGRHLMYLKLMLLTSYFFLYNLGRHLEGHRLPVLNYDSVRSPLEREAYGALAFCLIRLIPKVAKKPD